MREACGPYGEPGGVAGGPGGGVPARASDWADTRRRRWSASRIAAAVLLHALLLVALRLALDRVELPRRGPERSTRLVEIVLAPLVARPTVPPAARRATPRTQGAAAASPRADARPPVTQRAPVPPADADAANAITLTAAVPPAAASAALAAEPPVSAASSIAELLASRATRLAIREAGRNPLLSERAAAATGIAPPPGAEARLAQGVESARKGDCMKGEYAFAGAGLLSLPFLVAAEAMGHCSSH